jgi:hypothetical protein
MPAPSPDEPLQGGCLCGGVRYEVTAPWHSSGYCHCSHCQRRTGTASSVNARVPREGFAFLQGAELVRSYEPPGGRPKAFCSVCGSALFSGDLDEDTLVAVRLGTLDGDPGIRPGYRQFVEKAVAWEPIPEDGLTRHVGSRAG